MSKTLNVNGHLKYLFSCNIVGRCQIQDILSKHLNFILLSHCFIFCYLCQDFFLFFLHLPKEEVMKRFEKLCFVTHMTFTKYSVNHTFSLHLPKLFFSCFPFEQHICSIFYVFQASLQHNYNVVKMCGLTLQCTLCKHGACFNALA